MASADDDAIDHALMSAARAEIAGALEHIERRYGIAGAAFFTAAAEAIGYFIYGRARAGQAVHVGELMTTHIRLTLDALLAGHAPAPGATLADSEPMGRA